MMVGDSGQTGLWCSLSEQSQLSICLSIQQVGSGQVRSGQVWSTKVEGGVNNNYYFGQLKMVPSNIMKTCEKIKLNKYCKYRSSANDSFHDNFFKQF